MEDTDKRPSWDYIWMEMARIIAKRSHDEKYQVGSVIVTEDNTQVISVGYNGNYAGGPNFAVSSTPGESGLIHAEINALIKMDFNNPKKRKMYVTLSPCVMCAKSIVNAGISEVIYENDYRDLSGITLLENAGLIVRKTYL